ncbi:AraC family transcriptional regulator [candidate division KSB1 bacterium]|nr:AraC family transcriptional regulator [candidate division KSB1 bacterium]
MKESTEQDYRTRLLRVLVHIQTHLDEAIELDQLAAIANFSPYHFHRIFRGMTGESVMDHVRRLRLERAAVMLKLEQDSVTQIAFQAGYETLDAFSRSFGAMFGHPPSEYRKQKSPPAVTRNRIPFSVRGQVELDRLPQGESEMDVAIKTIEPITVIFVRASGPYGCPAIGAAWQTLFQWAFPRGLVHGVPKMLGICHDDPEVTPPEKIRYDACLVVDREVTAAGVVGVQTVGGGEFAVAVHKGSYNKLGETYTELCGRWIPNSNYRLRSSAGLEFYLNNPQSTNEDELLTEVCMPVERDGALSISGANSVV